MTERYCSFNRFLRYICRGSDGGRSRCLGSTGRDAAADELPRFVLHVSPDFLDVHAKTSEFVNVGCPIRLHLQSFLQFKAHL